MKNVASIFLVILAVILILTNMNGCSIIGYGIGSAIDGGKENYRNTEKWQLDEAKKGRKARITLKDSEVFQGSYRGLDSLDYEKYTATCNENDKRAIDGVTLPCPEDPVTIITTAGDSIAGKLLGYDINYAIGLDRDSSPTVSGLKYDLYRLSYIANGNDSPNSLFLTQIQSVTGGNGDPIDGGLLREKAASGNLPLRSTINLRIKWDIHQVPVDQIETVELDSAHHTKYYLLAVGLVIDGCCIAMAIALSQTEMGLGSSGGSW